MSLHNRLALILGVSQLLGWAMTYYLPAVTTEAVGASFGASRAQVLGAFSLALLATGLASPAICRRIDKVGGRAVLMAGTVCQAAGLLVMAGAGGLVQWYAGWLITGFGMAAALYDAAFATTGRLLGSAARPTITAITLLGGFASSLGWPLGTILVPAIGWRMTLVAYAAVFLAVNLPLLAALPRTVPPAPARMPGAPEHARGRRTTFALMAGFFTLRALIITVVTVSAPALLQGLGLGLVAAIGLMSLIGPAQVGIRFLQATIGKSLRPLANAWVSAIMLPLVTFPLALATGSSWLYALAGVFVVGYGVSNGILTIARGTLPLQLFGPDGYATRVGQLAMPVIIAQAAAPLLSAPLIAAWPAAWVFTGLGALSLLAASCLVPLRPR